jgi:hypothetical protein
MLTEPDHELFATGKASEIFSPDEMDVETDRVGPEVDDRYSRRA